MAAPWQPGAAQASPCPRKSERLTPPLQFRLVKAALAAAPGDARHTPPPSDPPTTAPLEGSGAGAPSARRGTHGPRLEGFISSRRNYGQTRVRVKVKEQAEGLCIPQGKAESVALRSHHRGWTVR